MGELGIIEFNLTTKFNKNNNTEERIMRVILSFIVRLRRNNQLEI